MKGKDKAEIQSKIHARRVSCTVTLPNFQIKR